MGIEVFPSIGIGIGIEVCQIRGIGIGIGIAQMSFWVLVLVLRLKIMVLSVSGNQLSFELSTTSVRYDLVVRMGLFTYELVPLVLFCHLSLFPILQK